jgi:hypothetical protein
VHRPERDIDGARADEFPESACRVHAQFDGQIIGARRKQLDQAWRGVFGERARRGDAEQPAPVGGLGHLDCGLSLQTEDFDCPAGQPKSAGRERETCRGPAEQGVVEFLA